MELILYKVTDSNNTLSKTLDTGLSIDVNFKKDTDINNPDIVLSDIEGIQTGRFNYIHIPSLDRYYFINHVRQVNNRMVNLICETDLLMTYKDIILNSKARLKRNIKTGDYLQFKTDSEIFTTVTILESDKSLTGNESNPILTTIGL